MVENAGIRSSAIDEDTVGLHDTLTKKEDVRRMEGALMAILQSQEALQAAVTELRASAPGGQSQCRPQEMC